MKKGLMLLFALCAATVFAAGTESAGLNITHRMMTLAIQVGVILFAARFGNLLFSWLRLPSVLGELCAGILIGPYALGTLWPGWVFQLFPGSSVGVSPELYGLCTVASIVLLFLVGAETDLRMFMRYSAVGSLVGVGGVVFSYLAGATIGVWLLGLEWSDPTTILLGVMSTATSVSITARILSDRRKLDSQEGVTILAGAVIDDVLGIIMLAIGMGLIAAKENGDAFSWGHIVGIAAKCMGIWLGATAVGILVSRKVAWLLRFCGSHGEVAILTLGLALLVGGLFEQASLAMIIGAYVTGLSFSRTDMGVMIQEKLHGVYQFLVPIFFVVMGMMVNIGEFAKEGVLVAGLIYTAVAVVAKIVGCGLPTLLFGFTPVGALRVGLGMVPRGEVALIIAGIAAAHGHTEILGVAVLMTMLTTLVSPPLLLAAFAIGRPGHRQEAARDGQPVAAYHFPNRAITSTVMGKILQNLTKEGFFTHQINPAQGLYQARRDDIVVNITCGEMEIAFSASQEAQPFVRIVMAESLAEFETVLDALRKPIAESAHFAIDASTPPPKPRAKPAGRLDVLARHVREEAIIPRLKATDRDGAIRELLGRLHDLGAVGDVAEAEAEVFRREAVMPTGVGFGVACPHARTNAVPMLTCAIGIAGRPIDFSPDEEGRACRIIILTLTPDTVNSPYMTFITAALTALRAPSKRQALTEAPDAAAIRAILLAP